MKWFKLKLNYCLYLLWLKMLDEYVLYSTHVKKFKDLTEKQQTYKLLKYNSLKCVAFKIIESTIYHCVITYHNFNTYIVFLLLSNLCEWAILYTLTLVRHSHALAGTAIKVFFSASANSHGVAYGAKWRAENVCKRLLLRSFAMLTVAAIKWQNLPLSARSLRSSLLRYCVVCSLRNNDTRTTISYLSLICMQHTVLHQPSGWIEKKQKNIHVCLQSCGLGFWKSRNNGFQLVGWILQYSLFMRFAFKFIN